MAGHCTLSPALLPSVSDVGFSFCQRVSAEDRRNMLPLSSARTRPSGAGRGHPLLHGRTVPSFPAPHCRNLYVP